MFRGLHEHSIDAKGRTSLPARFREVLGRVGEGGGGDDGAESTEDRLILTTSIDRCLVAYPVPEWRAFEAKLAALSQFDPAVVQLKRIYVAGATEAVIDKHGRLLIPPMLRAYAGLDRELIWAGMVTTIEVWAKEAWSAQVAASRADPSAIARALTELGL
jgi:MraZ protein